MGETGTALAIPEVAVRATGWGRPADHQWHSMDTPHRCAVARFAGTLRGRGDGLESVLPMAEGWGVGAHLQPSAATGRPGGANRLGSPVCRRDHCARPSPRSRGKRGGAASEALGYSQGGFSTKVHLRAEGGGQLMTLLLTPGQQHESTMFAPLLDQGAVKRCGRGRPRLRPRRIVGDKGYSYPHLWVSPIFTRRYTLRTFDQLMQPLFW